MLGSLALAARGEGPKFCFRRSGCHVPHLAIVRKADVGLSHNTVAIAIATANKTLVVRVSAQGRSGIDITSREEDGDATSRVDSMMQIPRREHTPAHLQWPLVTPVSLQTPSTRGSMGEVPRCQRKLSQRRRPHRYDCPLRLKRSRYVAQSQLPASAPAKAETERCPHESLGITRDSLAVNRPRDLLVRSAMRNGFCT